MAEDRLNLPFTGLVSVMRAPTCDDFDKLDADIAILGTPTDEGSPWKPGARFAPRKIRELSVKYAGYGPLQHQKGYYDIEEDRRYLEYERQHHRIVDCGDSDIIYTNVRSTFDNITRDVKRILKAGAFPVVIGGDHAVTYPVVRAYEERLNVVHFDAHMDYRPFVHGVQWANGNPIRNVAQLKTCHHIIQVGIRSLRTSQADVEDSRARGNDIVTVPEFRRRGATHHRVPRTDRGASRVPEASPEEAARPGGRRLERCQAAAGRARQGLRRTACAGGRVTSSPREFVIPAGHARMCRMRAREAVTMNLFAHSPVLPESRYLSAVSPARPGDSVTLLARKDLIAARSACPQDLALTDAWRVSDLTVRLS